MTLIIRIDVDRPYGKHPAHRHLVSRIASDLYFPGVEAFGYLKELKQMLQILNQAKARAYTFFRKCTLPSASVMELMRQGGHEIGLHLENSRSLDTFLEEKTNLERYVGQSINSISKHGSGKIKYGLNHYAPYEPNRYTEWAIQTGITVFLGNFEDPTLEPVVNGNLLYFPSAYWLEPHWRDTRKFTEDWLLANAPIRDIVMLVHPENVLESPELTQSFTRLANSLETKILE